MRDLMTSDSNKPSLASSTHDNRRYVNSLQDGGPSPGVCPTPEHGPCPGKTPDCVATFLPCSGKPAGAWNLSRSARPVRR